MNPKIAHRGEQNGSFLKNLNSYNYYPLQARELPGKEFPSCERKQTYFAEFQRETTSKAGFCQGF